jgi:hypothetical protein
MALESSRRFSVFDLLVLERRLGGVAAPGGRWRTMVSIYVVPFAACGAPPSGGIGSHRLAVVGWGTVDWRIAFDLLVRAGPRADGDGVGPAPPAWRLVQGVAVP